MKYRVGDKVRIVNHRNPWWNRSGYMDKWMGKVMTIRTVISDGFYEMEEDTKENCGIGWGWSDEDFAELITKPKYYDGKVVCVMSKDDEFTVGKIYTFVDGTVKDNLGNVRYEICPIEDPSQIVNVWRFIPYVE